MREGGRNFFKNRFTCEISKFCYLFFSKKKCHKCAKSGAKCAKCAKCAKSATFGTSQDHNYHQEKSRKKAI